MKPAVHHRSARQQRQGTPTNVIHLAPHQSLSPVQCKCDRAIFGAADSFVVSCVPNRLTGAISSSRWRSHIPNLALTTTRHRGSRRHASRRHLRLAVVEDRHSYEKKYECNESALQITLLNKNASDPMHLMQTPCI